MDRAAPSRGVIDKEIVNVNELSNRTDIQRHYGLATFVQSQVVLTITALWLEHPTT